jgi:hypothetical protein
MSLRNYILLMLFATLACFLILLAVLNFFEPSNIWAIIFFYTSLFLTLLGAFSLIGLFLRLAFTKDTLVFKKVTTSFRQAIWFSLLIIICLYLNRLNLFVWKNVFLLIIGLLILELFFMSYKSKPSLKI